jgi:hypothetical protein
VTDEAWSAWSKSNGIYFRGVPLREIAKHLTDMSRAPGAEDITVDLGFCPGITESTCNILAPDVPAAVPAAVIAELARLARIPDANHLQFDVKIGGVVDEIRDRERDFTRRLAVEKRARDLRDLTEKMLRRLCASDDETKAWLERVLDYGVGSELLVGECYRDPVEISRRQHRPNWMLDPRAPVPPLRLVRPKSDDLWGVPRAPKLEDVVKILEWIVFATSGTPDMHVRRYKSAAARHYGKVRKGRPRGAQTTQGTFRKFIWDLMDVVHALGGRRLRGKRLAKAIELLRPYISRVATDHVKAPDGRV